MKFVPTVVATKYLKSIGKLSGAHDKHSILRTGYNQLLERKNPDGSFNLWSYEKSDSIWLTAYVVKCLGHVKHLININDVHIYDALSFLKTKQHSSGSFSEHGPISHRRIQGGLSHGVPLSAYVVISFLEHPDYVKDYQETIDLTLTFIDQNILNLNDNYAIAISAYALTLGKHESSKKVLAHLKESAIMEEGLMHWAKDFGSSRVEAEPNLSVEVEIASYALLAFLKAGDLSTALSIMNWLLSRRNPEGGFYSTQDTVIGIQALAEITTIYYQATTNMNIKLNYRDGQKLMKIDETNKLTAQHFDISPSNREFWINANGTGNAVLNFWYSYKAKSEKLDQGYKLTVKTLLSKNGGIFFLTVCIRFIPTEIQKSSSMTVVEIKLPSGYIYDSDSTPLLKEFNVKVSLRHHFFLPFKTFLNLFRKSKRKIVKHL